MRFKKGDYVWISDWKRLSVVKDVHPKCYELDLPSFYYGWFEHHLQAVSMSFAGPVLLKKWKKHGKAQTR